MTIAPETPAPAVHAGTADPCAAVENVVTVDSPEPPGLVHPVSAFLLGNRTVILR
ncbi:MAG: hypothetical protein ABWY04_18055 [Arthrobacter sp.]